MLCRKPYTPLFLLAVLAAACGTANDPAGAESAEVDPQADDDGDGVPHADDRCAEAAPEGAWVGADGCAADQDGDSDGLSTDRDLCPGTPAGAAVDGNGCSQEQREGAAGGAGGATGTGGSETSERAGAIRTGAIGDWQPNDDGSVGVNGFATFVLDPNGAFPVVIRTLAQNVLARADGFDLRGTVLIDVPGGTPITLLEAEVALDRGAGGGLESFRGAVRVPFPETGFMEGVSVGDPVHAAVGYDYGRNLSDVEVPLGDERKYFYFTFSAGFDAEIGDMTVSTGVNQSATMALDPSDPAFFLRASLGGFMGPVDEASLGFSLGGQLEFTPEVTWGIDAEATSFQGHLWVGGAINLNALGLPLGIGGNTVYDFDPDDDGRSFFQDPSGGLGFGSNAELSVAIDAALIAFEVPIAGSTIVGRAGASGAAAYYSGVIRAGNGWMPELVPLKNTQELRVAGHASSDVGESYFAAEGRMSFDAGKLGEWTGLDLEDLAVAEASLLVDRDGVLVQGTTSARFSPHLDLSGEVATEAFFSGDPEEWYLSLDGRLSVSGVDLSSEAHALLDRNGMLVSGTFDTPISSIAMSGAITRSGVDVRGRAQVTIPIVAGREVIQVVTDAAVCGVETVTDATVCGVQTVTNVSQCGYETVRDGGRCGYETVRDATLCGTSYVTSAAQCGSDTVTSGAQCGWDYFSDLAHCGWSCISSGNCSCRFARTCSVPRSCQIANTCSVEATCNVARTCEVPASCERVKTCETRVTIPDFDYGTFRGSADVTIGTSGLGGSVAGQYCPTGGGCTTLAGGRVRTSGGTPEACVSVASLGEFCAGF